MLLEGARGIEPPPGFADRANGFEARGAPSTIAPGLELVQAQVGWLELPQRMGIKPKKMMSRFSGHTARLPNTGSVSIHAQVKPKNRFIGELLAGIMNGDYAGNFDLSNWKFR